MAGMDKSKVMKRGGMKTKVMKRGGKKTKVKKMGRGKKTSMQGGVEHYQDYVKRMFGGGVTKKGDGGALDVHGNIGGGAETLLPSLKKPPSLRNTRSGVNPMGVDRKPRRPRKAVVRKKPVFRPTKADDRGL
jgi:hypothetical protein